MERPLRHVPRLTRLCLIALIACAPATAARADATDDRLGRARAALAAGDYEAAMALATEAVTAAPKDARPYLFRAGLHDALGAPEEALADYDKVVELRPKDANAYQRRGVARFKLGRVKESAADFDKVVALRPAEKAYHWQRGISLYYAGEYEAGREQFEQHQTVNPSDVENAAWHFLCVARVEGVEQARASLIPIVGDARVPMAQIHALYAGKAKPDDVIAAATAGAPAPQRLRDQLFYAHLYVGLYHEAAGDAKAAKRHIDLAAGEFAQPHYMGDVARVHAKRLEPKPPAASEPKK